MTSPLRLRLLGPILLLAIVGIANLIVTERSDVATDHQRALTQHDLALGIAMEPVRATFKAMALPLAAAAEHTFVGFGAPTAADCNRWLKEADGAVSYVAVVTPGADLLCATLPFDEAMVAALASREYVRRAFTTRQAQFTGPFYSSITGTWVFVRARPLLRGGEPVAVMVAAVDSARLIGPLVPTNGTQPHTLWYSLDGGTWLTTTVGGEWREASPGVEPPVRPVMSVEIGGVVWSRVEVGDPPIEILLSEPAAALFVAAGGTTNTQYTVWVAVGLSALALAFIELGVVRRIRFLALRSGEPLPGTLDVLARDELDAVAAALDRRAELVSHAATLSEDLERLHADRVEWAQRSLRSLNQAVEKRMPFLRNHGQRVGMYAAAIGRQMGLAAAEVEQLQLAGELHDIGKTTVADAVYLKPGPLDPIEMSDMQLHTVQGEEIVKLLNPDGDAIATVSRYHHERWDGTGYPDRLAGEAIPLWARIVAVADSYDAMTEERPYRPPKTHEEALAELHDGAGSQWDPRAVEAFLAVLDSPERPS